MRLVKQGSVTLVYYGRDLLGSVERRVSFYSRGVLKWHAFSNQTCSTHKTKKEAIQWLWLLYNNKEAAQHLKELRMFGEVVDNDNGFLDVLRHFATYLGYSFIDHKESRHLSGMIWYTERNIYLNEFRTRVEKTQTLAHELAHHYIYLYYPNIKKKAEEQLAEAIAVAILKDYDIDNTHRGLAYVYSHATSHCAFALGHLDNAFVVCYNRFRSDLKAFLKTT